MKLIGEGFYTLITFVFNFFMVQAYPPKMNPQAQNNDVGDYIHQDNEG